MESIPTARAKEDIALDLLKFIASAAHIGAKGAGATGFGATGGSKPEDQIAQLLELYGRCRVAVESPTPALGSGTSAPTK